MVEIDIECMDIMWKGYPSTFHVKQIEKERSRLFLREACVGNETRTIKLNDLCYVYRMLLVRAI